MRARRGAKVALLTTENFRDTCTIPGNDRGEIFSIRWNEPPLLTPLEHTFTERDRDQRLRPVAVSGPSRGHGRLCDTLARCAWVPAGGRRKVARAVPDPRFESRVGTNNRRERGGR